MKSTAAMIRALVKRGMTQEAIGQVIAVHRSQISRWHAGNTPKHADAVLRLRVLYEARCK